MLCRLQFNFLDIFFLWKKKKKWKVSSLQGIGAHRATDMWSETLCQSSGLLLKNVEPFFLWILDFALLVPFIKSVMDSPLMRMGFSRYCGPLICHSSASKGRKVYRLELYQREGIQSADEMGRIRKLAFKRSFLWLPDERVIKVT